MMIIGHRGLGAKGKYLQNSLPAFMEALRQGADGIELDVWKTMDGADLFVSHGAKADDHAPSLRDVFNVMASRTPPPLINIELKGPDTYALAQKQARDFCTETGYPYDRILFSSFDHEELLKLRHIDDDAKIGLLFGSTYGPWTLPLKLYPETDSPKRRKPLTAKYMEAVMGTIRPTSLCAAATNFKKAKGLAEKYNLDLYVWASYGEGPPDRDHRLEKVVKGEAANPHIHVITDYTAALALVRRQAIDIKR